MSDTIHKPATPLPELQSGPWGDGSTPESGTNIYASSLEIILVQDIEKEWGDEIVKRCNAYPKLVKALGMIENGDPGPDGNLHAGAQADIARDALKAVGELPEPSQ